MLSESLAAMAEEFHRWGVMGGVRMEPDAALIFAESFATLADQARDMEQALAPVTVLPKAANE